MKRAYLLSIILIIANINVFALNPENKSFTSHSDPYLADADTTVQKLIFRQAGSLPFPLVFHSAVTDSSYAYTIGGVSLKSGLSRQALKYDPVSDQWIQLSNKIKPVVQASAGYIAATHKIYIIGGLTSLINFSLFGAVQTVDVKTGEVEQLKIENPMPRAYAGSAVWNNKMYIFGGSTKVTTGFQGVSTNAFYEFDPLTNIFTKLPDMPEAVQTSGTVVNGILYVFGGYNSQLNKTSKNIYAYDIQQQKWQLVCKSPVDLTANGISAYGDLIFITGGYYNQGLTAYLNTITHEFKVIKSNLSPRKHSSAVSLYGHLMVIGGMNDISSLKSNQVADLKDILLQE